jgi:hypothetical protein
VALSLPGKLAATNLARSEIVVETAGSPPA